MAKKKVVKVNNVDHSGSNPQKAGAGTIKNNLERYRSDDVNDVKAKQGRNADVNRDKKRELSPKEKKGRKKKVAVRICITVLILLLCAAGFTFMYWVFHDVPVNEEDQKKIEVTISEGASDEEVGAMLHEAGCIKSESQYKLRTYIYDANYVPGVYTISPSYTTEKIINILSGYDYTQDGLMDE